MKRDPSIYCMIIIRAYGLVNSSNYCYMNATLQCVYTVGELVDIFKSKEYKKANSRDKTLSDILSKLFTEVVQTRQKVINPSSLQVFFRKKFPEGNQEDCHEYLTTLLNKLKDETNSHSKLVKIKNDLSLEECWSKYCQYNDSIIDKLFGGQSENCVLCTKCSYRSCTYEHFLYLLLPCMDDKSHEFGSTFESLSYYFKEEMLGFDIGYKCEKCKTVIKAIRKNSITHLPRYLFIIFKRYRIGRHISKYSKFISYPKQLNLKEYCTSKQNSTYTLIGAIIHSGNAQYGHYTSIARRGDTWYHFDDMDYKAITDNTALSKEAYVLLYMR